MKLNDAINRLFCFITSIVKVFLVSFIIFCGSFGGLLLGNLALPEVLSDWSIENPFIYVFIIIPLIVIISTVLSQYLKRFSKNTITHFVYTFLIFLSLFGLKDIIGNSVLAKGFVLSSYLTLTIYNVFPSIFGAIGIKALWR